MRSEIDRDSIGGQTTELDAGAQVAERTHLEPGDHERYSHYVRKEKIVESAVLGTPVIALCGKTWVPGRDPEKFPICPICKEIYEGLRPEEPESSDSGSD